MDRGTIHIDQALTNISVGYKNTEFIAAEVLPVVPVAKESDKYFIFGKENFRLENDDRANGAPSNRTVSWTVSTDGYNCKKKSLHDVITRDDRANADAPLQPDITTTQRLTEKIQLRREHSVASYLFNTATFSGRTAALTGAAQWSDYVNSNPLKNIDDAIDSIEREVGISPNTIVMGREVFNKVKRHPDVLDLYKHTQKGIITPDILAEAFGVERILVGKSVFNSAPEGASPAMTRLWGKFVLICYVTKVPAINSPSLGYTFNWKIYGNNTWMTKKWWDDNIDGDKIEVTTSYDVKITAPEAGYLYSTVIA